MKIQCRFLPSLAAIGLVLAGALPSLAQPAKGKPAPHPAIRRVTTAELAAWFCKGLAGDDPRKLAATFFGGKLKGEADANRWYASVNAEGKELIDISLLGSAYAGWQLALYLEGEWHGISEADWKAFARKIPGTIQDIEGKGSMIILPEAAGGYDRSAYFETRPGYRELLLLWKSPPGPHPTAWFCPKS